jgi:hypothetical protein
MQISPIYLDGEAYERFNGRWSRISGRDFTDDAGYGFATTSTKQYSRQN